MKSPLDIWRPINIPAGCGYNWQVGPLEFVVYRAPGEWHISTRRDADQDARLRGPTACAESAEGLRRWVAALDETTIYLRAVMPNRPLVVRPDAPLTMLPGQNATFFVGVPIWIRVKARNNSDGILCDLPTVVLSNSWFGTPTEGELCYAMRTTAKRDESELERRPYRAICPVEIRNAADTALEITRLCLRVQELQVFQGTDHLWTAPARITYRGEGELSRIVFGKTPGSFAENATAIGEPHEMHSRGFMAKAFQVIRGYATEDRS